jgi:hypothetical protein
MVIVPEPAQPGIACCAWAATAARRTAWHGPYNTSIPSDHQFSYLQTLSGYSRHSSFSLSLILFVASPPLPSAPRLRAVTAASLLTGPVLPSPPSSSLRRRPAGAAMAGAGGSRCARRWRQAQQPAGCGRHEHDGGPVLFGLARRAARHSPLV